MAVICKTCWHLLILVIVFRGGYLSAADESSKLGTVVGIDLGTTYSSIGVYNNGHVEIIRNDQGNKITPSWVAFTDNETLIGEAAKNQAHTNAKRTIFNVKRIIGRNFTDDIVQRFINLVPYKIVNKEGKPCIEVEIKDGHTKVFSPEEISAMIITKMMETAEDFLGKEIEDAVITVPANFDEAQRNATRDAGAIAGLNVVSIINEPSAAAIAYGLDNKSGARNVLVYHLGGGTMDVSILKIENGILKVLATDGHTHLGGEDIDAIMVEEHFIDMIKWENGKDISKNSKALGKLRRECERAKIALSTQDEVRIEIESLCEGFNYSTSLSLPAFVDLSNGLLRITLRFVKKAMEDAGLKKSQIDEIVLVGGSTKIPRLQQRLKDYFRGKDAYKGLNPEEAAVYGAVIQGATLSGEGGAKTKDILLLDVPPPVGPKSARLVIQSFSGIVAVPCISEFMMQRFS